MKKGEILTDINPAALQRKIRNKFREAVEAEAAEKCREIEKLKRYRVKVLLVQKKFRM